jgi:hypothetical protein
VVIYPPRVFPSESQNLKMLFATKISCFARFFVRIRS